MGHLIVDADDYGPFASIECSAPGCRNHLALRPALASQTLYDLVCAAYDMAADDGWHFSGRAWCPAHADPELPGRPVRVGDGFDWLKVQRAH